MNKKQRNRKNVTQNKRNRMVNRRYISTIKTLFKVFLKLREKKDEENEMKEKQILVNNLYSIIDKAVKKRVLHKNTAARKKSRIFSLFSKK
jgi:small subunit ribosomal protein S20